MPSLPSLTLTQPMPAAGLAAWSAPPGLTLPRPLVAPPLSLAAAPVLAPPIPDPRRADERTSGTKVVLEAECFHPAVSLAMT